MTKMFNLHINSIDSDIDKLNTILSADTINKMKTEFKKTKSGCLIFDPFYDVQIHNIESGRSDSFIISVKQKANSDKDEKLKFLGEISTNLFHEINTPLNIMISSLEIFKMELFDEFEPEVVKLAYDKLESFEIGLLKFCNIIKGLQNFAQGKHEYRKVDLDTFTKSTVDFANMFLKKNHINITFRNTLHFNQKVTIQDTLMSQVLINLIKNSSDAIKHMPPFDRWIEIHLTEFPDSFCYEVRDSGKGIPEDIQKNLFEYGFSTKGAGEGCGIGLSFCKKIVEQHKGTIVYNKNKENTSFLIKFPKTEAQAIAA